MPTCKGCGNESNALHYGGDADIRAPGVCTRCEERITRAHRAALTEPASVSPTVAAPEVATAGVV